MSSPISIMELVRIKNYPESEWYIVDRIYPDTHRAQVHVIGILPPGERHQSQIIPLEDLIPAVYECYDGRCGQPRASRELSLDSNFDRLAG